MAISEETPRAYDEKDKNMDGTDKEKGPYQKHRKIGKT
jgi:hypothetical protein